VQCNILVETAKEALILRRCAMQQFGAVQAARTNRSGA
jgi:hypothetical protein